MESTAKASLQGLRVVSFESRRAKEMAELIRRYGGDPIVAPSMREIPLSENRAVIGLLPQLEAGKIDLLILMTGVGTRTLNEALRTQFPQERIIAALRRTTLVARGPKPVAALKELGLAAALTAPEPNTWREVLGTLDAAGAMSGKRIVLQEFGVPNPELVAGLEQRGARVKTIAIYRWAMPQDLEPLRDAIQKILHGGVDMALFTNGAQIEHLWRVAAETKVEQKLRLAFNNDVAVGSVGPVCTEALQRFALKPDIEPAHPKMGALIAAVAAAAHEILTSKRATSA